MYFNILFYFQELCLPIKSEGIDSTNQSSQSYRERFYEQYIYDSAKRRQVKTLLYRFLLTSNKRFI